MFVTEVVAVLAVGALVTLCCLVAICLRGTSPAQRPEILRALGEMLRDVWPSSTGQIDDGAAPAARPGGRRARHRRRAVPRGPAAGSDVPPQC